MHVRDMLTTLFSQYGPTLLMDPAVRKCIMQSSATDFIVAKIDVLNSADLGAGIVTYRVRLEYRSAKPVHMFSVHDVVTVTVKGSAQRLSAASGWSVTSCSVLTCTGDSINLDDVDTDPEMRAPSAP